MKNSKIISLLLLVLIFSSLSFAQFSRKNYKILDIRVEGNISTDPATIIANSGLSVGSEIQIPGDKTAKAIERLWNLKIFSDVKIIEEKVVGDGLFLLIKVSEYPRIEEFVISGNDEVSETDIKEKTNFITGQTIKPEDYFNIKREINKLYVEEGYLNTEIEINEYGFGSVDTVENVLRAIWINKADPKQTHFTEYDLDIYKSPRLIEKFKNRIVIDCVIDEGDELKITQIKFSGNKSFSDDELESSFEETNSYVWWKFWQNNKFDREKFEEDLLKLKNFYKKNGFRDVEVLGDSLIIDKEEDEIHLEITLNEGKRYYVKSIAWEGNSVYSDAMLSERLDLKKGDIYNYEKFTKNLYQNETQTEVAGLYQNEGYLRQVMIPEEIIKDDSVQIKIKIIENNQFKIDQVNIKGNNRTMEKVIRRELYTVPGDFYNKSLVLRSIQQLANLQYFNIEKLYTEGIDFRPVSDSTVNIEYKVEEKSSDYLNASVGYSEYWGMTGSIGVTLSNFSIESPFTMGGGQILSFNWQFGVNQPYRTFSLGFTEPWFMDTPTSVGFDIFDTRNRLYYDLRQTGANIRVGRRLKWPDNYFYIQGLFKYQDNDIKTGRTYYNEGQYSQFTLGFLISRTDIDNPIFPSRGSKFSLNSQISGGPFLPGDVEFYKIHLKSDWYQNLFNTNRIALYGGVEMGYIEKLGNSRTQVPYFEQYFMGGNGMAAYTTPLRGYLDTSIGPREFGAERTYGGNVLVKYTMELRAALAMEPMPIYVLAFAEAGNVFESGFKADFSDLKRSIGFGARIMIQPVGLLGFDYGYGFDRRSVDGAEPGWEFHFQFGKNL